MATSMSAESFIDSVRRWAEVRNDILALAVVGSYARGDARADSDIDLVLICSDPTRYLADPSWASAFGKVNDHVVEDWGLVQSVRVFYQDGPEVEFGIAGTGWTEIPPDPGTAAVVLDGCSNLLDRDGRLSRLLAVVGKSA
jgi:predicted nucleotidyltransferase